MKTRQQQAESMNITFDDLYTIDPITKHQREAWDAFKNDGDHLVLAGTAGTGKTYLAMYMALELVMDKSTPYDSLVIVRSVVPTREVGYLPGTLQDKLDAFTGPYRAACHELFNDSRAYEKLVHNNFIRFESTSYIRGVTFDNSIILVDEMQNLNFHELDSVITRVGQATRIVFCGDYHQSDFKNNNEKEGIKQFLSILENMKNFSIINFSWEDIVRSDFVRDYIMTKEWMGIQ